MNRLWKRAAALALAGALMLPLAACGGGTNSPEHSTENSPAAEVSPTPEPTPTPPADPYDAVRNYWSEDQLTQA